MPSILTKFSLFISSFYPLALIYFLMLKDEHMGLAWSIIAFCTLFVIIAGVFLYILQESSVEAITVKKATTQVEATTTYLISYILPFTSISISDINQVLSLVIVFLILAYLYINSNMIFINPILNLAGYRIYHVENTIQDNYIVLTSVNIKKGDVIQAVPLGDGMFFVPKVKETT